jgi:DNA repair exonuclease SbcCD ATPase subunit
MVQAVGCCAQVIATIHRLQTLATGVQVDELRAKLEVLKRASLEATEHTETLQEEGARLRAELASSAEESECASQQAQRSAQSAAAELARCREELAHSSEAQQRAMDAQTVLEQEKGELQKLAGKQAALHGFTARNPTLDPTTRCAEHAL